MTGPYRNPIPTVDAIIRLGNQGIVLVYRRNPPIGWALPGGFVDYGEPLETAALREALEETGLEVELERQFHTYSDPSRDPRHHTISTVFVCRAEGEPRAGSDARHVGVFPPDGLPEPMVFDHAEIIRDWVTKRY